MIHKVKSLLRPIVPQFLLNRIRVKNEQQHYTDWLSEGKIIPPPHIVKQKVIKHFQELSGYEILVETGTFLGDMVEAQKRNFKKIISIELSEYYFKKSKNRFKHDKKVEIIKGDSGKVLPSILKEIKQGVIFWLDGHYSSGLTAKGDLNCPIYEEINAIFNYQKPYNPIILVDDARLFVGELDYPTQTDLFNFIKTKDKDYSMHVEDDVMKFIKNQ